MAWLDTSITTYWMPASTISAKYFCTRKDSGVVLTAGMCPVSYTHLTDYAIQQARDLIEGGADGIHLYAMNNADVTQRMYDGIKDLL